MQKPVLSFGEQVPVVLGPQCLRRAIMPAKNPTAAAPNTVRKGLAFTKSSELEIASCALLCTVPQVSLRSNFREEISLLGELIEELPESEAPEGR